jgi:hypothetical protein
MFSVRIDGLSGGRVHTQTAQSDRTAYKEGYGIRSRHFCEDYTAVLYIMYIHCMILIPIDVVRLGVAAARCKVGIMYSYREKPVSGVDSASRPATHHGRRWQPLELGALEDQRMPSHQIRSLQYFQSRNKNKPRYFYFDFMNPARVRYPWPLLFSSCPPGPSRSLSS